MVYWWSHGVAAFSQNNAVITTIISNSMLSFLSLIFLSASVGEAPKIIMPNPTPYSDRLSIIFEKAAEKLTVCWITVTH